MFRKVLRPLSMCVIFDFILLLFFVHSCSRFFRVGARVFFVCELPGGQRDFASRRCCRKLDLRLAAGLLLCVVRLAFQLERCGYFLCRCHYRNEHLRRSPSGLEATHASDPGARLLCRWWFEIVSILKFCILLYFSSFFWQSCRPKCASIAFSPLGAGDGEGNPNLPIIPF